MVMTVYACLMLADMNWHKANTEDNMETSDNTPEDNSAIADDSATSSNLHTLDACITAENIVVADNDTNWVFADLVIADTFNFILQYDNNICPKMTKICLDIVIPQRSDWVHCVSKKNSYLVKYQLNKFLYCNHLFCDWQSGKKYVFGTPSRKLIALSYYVPYYSASSILSL